MAVQVTPKCCSLDQSLFPLGYMAFWTCWLLPLMRFESKACGCLSWNRRHSKCRGSMIGLSRQAWGGLASNPTLALLSSAEVLSPCGGFDIQAAVPWITKTHVLQPPGLPATPASFRGIDSGGAEALIHLQGKEIVVNTLIKQCSFAAFRMWCGWCVCVCVCVCVCDRGFQWWVPDLGREH